MYKIAIVDDEDEIREGIEDLIQWENHGFQFIGSFENGNEALKVFEDRVPDLVLTDICMPYMDGVELTRYLADKYPLTKVIMLTGYDDFQYTQQAIQLRVYDYILKPFSANQLRSVLDKAKLEMDEDNRKKEDIHKLKLQLNQSLPLLKERFLESLVTAPMKGKEIEEKLAFFNLPLSGPCYVAIVIDVDDFGERELSQSVTEQELMYYAVYNIIEEIMGSDQSIVFRNREDRIVVILSDEDTSKVQGTAQALSEETRNSVESYLRFTVTIGIGNPIRSLQGIVQAYQSALAALDNRFLLGKNKVITYPELDINQRTHIAMYPEWEKKLILAVRTGTGKEVNEAIEDYIRNLKNAFIPMKQCYFYIHKVCLALKDTMEEFGQLELFGDPIERLAEIDQYKTLDEIERWLSVICKQIVESVSGQSNNLSKSKVLMAEKYIKDHFSNESLALSDVCQHVQISPSYFGTVFKTYTGETFIEYVTRIRIEKAMELLKCTDLKTYEIAHNTGYKDPHYFSLIFKKKAGVSPTEYRGRIRNDPQPEVEGD
ncbi:response regulator [Cohnella terricola]|nr:response regulator [Cohnella terricola]